MTHRTAHDTPASALASAAVTTNDTTRLPERSMVAIFVLAAPLYLSFGAVIGFVQGGIPMIFRAEGRSIGSIGILYLLYLPIGFSFFWAPLVDRFGLPGIPGYKGWIVVMQIATASALFTVAVGEALSGAVLFMIGLLAAATTATMDIALEAFVVETVSARRRPAASALKMGTACLGIVLGGGMLLWLYDSLGWGGAFSVLGAFVIASAVPILILAAPNGAKPRDARRASALAALRNKNMRRRILLLLCASSVTGAAFGLNRVALVDIGVDLQRIGLIAGTIAPLAGTAAAITAGPAVIRFGRRAILYALLIPVLLSVTIMIGAVASSHVGENVALSAVILGFAISCAFTIVLGSTIIGWSAGAQVGTNFALQYGSSNIAATCVLFAASQSVRYLGWPLYFAVSGAFFIAMLLLFDPLARRLDAHEKK